MKLNEERSSARLGLVIVDGDDTLWSTQGLYDEAKQEFAALVKGPGMADGEAIELLDRLDAEQVAVEGYSPSRFVNSMIRTYQVLCARQGTEPARAVLETIEQSGKRVFNRSAAVYPEARECLQRLQAKYRLVLLTKGDRAIQQRRLRESGLKGLLDRVYIVPDKGSNEYQRVLQELKEEPERVWAVGNSIRSDINPALRSGLRCILLARPSWRYEEAELEAGDVSVVSNLSEAVAIIAARDRARQLEAKNERR